MRNYAVIPAQSALFIWPMPSGTPVPIYWSNSGGVQIG
jgi:hypothetical protein